MEGGRVTNLGRFGIRAVSAKEKGENVMSRSLFWEN
jgi:hypothetical protein